MTAATRRSRAQAVTGRRAGLVSRLLADGIDLLVTAILLFGFLVAFAVVRYMLGAGTLRLPHAGTTFTAIGFPLVEIAYLATTWSASGRSAGKELVGLRVVRGDGARLEPWRAGTRAAVCTIFGGPSLLWSALSSRNAALHDLMLGTTVVHDWPDAARRTASAAAAHPNGAS